MGPERPSHIPEQPHNATPRSQLKLDTKKLQKLQEQFNRRGVVYISRIPPHMKPQKLRHLLSQHGNLGRLYLAPEDPAWRKKRKQQGGNSGKNFTEGWVEFEDKEVAKQVAQMLNGNPIGGKHRSAFRFDLWNVKYLPKFKWDNLTEEIAYQNAVREQKLQNELSTAKRERDFYLQQVDKSKAVDAIKERKRKKLEGSADAAVVEGTVGEKRPKAMRSYKQRSAKADATDKDAPMLSHDVLSLVARKRDPL